MERKRHYFESSEAKRDYLVKLVECVAVLTPKATVLMTVCYDEMAGSVSVEFGDGDGYVLTVYATPFWSGDNGIPVQAWNPDADTLHEALVLPFMPTGDVERDAEEYVRLMEFVPRILNMKGI